jgi:hypothetical protein
VLTIPSPEVSRLQTPQLLGPESLYNCKEGRVAKFGDKLLNCYATDRMAVARPYVLHAKVQLS